MGTIIEKQAFVGEGGPVTLSSVPRVDYDSIHAQADPLLRDGPTVDPRRKQRRDRTIRSLGCV
jgi:hypothetical protein